MIIFLLIFILFQFKNTATQFLHYLNNCHANIKFTVEFEENSTIPFLDILIKRHNHTFSTSIYRKKTFTGLYTKWNSFTPRKYKVNLISTLNFCWYVGDTTTTPTLHAYIHVMNHDSLQSYFDHVLDVRRRLLFIKPSTCFTPRLLILRLSTRQSTLFVVSLSVRHLLFCDFVFLYWGSCCYRMVFLLVWSIPTSMIFWTDNKTNRKIQLAQFPKSKQS